MASEAVANLAEEIVPEERKAGPVSEHKHAEVRVDRNVAPDNAAVSEPHLAVLDQRLEHSHDLQRRLVRLVDHQAAPVSHRAHQRGVLPCDLLGARCWKRSEKRSEAKRSEAKRRSEARPAQNALFKATGSNAQFRMRCSGRAARVRSSGRAARMQRSEHAAQSNPLRARLSRVLLSRAALTRCSHALLSRAALTRCSHALLSRAALTRCSHAQLALLTLPSTSDGESVSCPTVESRCS